MVNQTLLNQILATGFPTSSHEAWKYTDLRRVANKSFQVASSDEVTIAAIKPWVMTDFYLVVVNGYWQPALSHLPSQIQLKEVTERTLNKTQDIFYQLNAAFCQQFLHLIISSPNNMPCLQIIYISTQENTWVQPRLMVEMAAQTKATILHTWTTSAASITNAVVDYQLAENAHLENIIWQQHAIQALHIERHSFHLAKNAGLRNHYYAIGGQLARSEITVNLAAENAITELYGLYLANGQQHLDQQTFIAHTGPHTRSEEHYRGILLDKSRAVFNGKVLVHPQAVYTEANQANHNLLLSSEAEIDTKPELEIYQNEVKCTHGATVGQLDAQALFYLQSRGLSLPIARQLLLQGFVEKIIAQLSLSDIAQTFHARLAEKYLCL